jgi:transcriptional regulator with XRE-family HTH domain
MVIIAYVQFVALVQQSIFLGEKMTIGKQIRKRRKELKMSVDELAQKIGKDRSTIYRYENGDIGNMPLDMLFPMTEALETTPQELLSTIITTNEWLSTQAEKWFDATEGYEFNEKEIKLFYEIAKYIMEIRHNEDYDEKISFLFALFNQLKK